MMTRFHAIYLTIAAAAIAAGATVFPIEIFAQSAAPGGFLELATSTTVRTPTVPSLPNRGKFTFPAPYNTVGVRLTNASDCGGKDCVDYVGYSYWRNSNNHVGSDTMLIFITLDRARGGDGPTLFSYDKNTDKVTVVGPLFDASSPLSWATGEGWYWSATLPNALYVNEGAKLYRYDVTARQLETVFDASTHFGADRYIWQTHSSDDDQVHSATLRSSTTFEMLGCMVYREDTHQYSYFAKIGDYDECQVDKSGRWLLIKDNVDGKNGEDNRIIDLTTGAQTIFLDEQGAAGHSDNGFGYMVAADNWAPEPGAVRVWTFGEPLPGVPPQGQLVYQTTDWSTDIGHLSHANARPDVPLEHQYVCGARAIRAKLPRANEIICFRLDPSLEVLVVAPIMTNLDAAGGGSDDYAKLPKGNLDITGQYYIWTSNTGGKRLDAFVVKVPAQQLVAGAGSTPAGGDALAISITAPAAAASISGAVAVSATTADNVGIAGVQFKLDGQKLGAELTKAPFSTNWNTETAGNGAHTLTAVARDASGNIATSAAVSVTVANTVASGPGPPRNVIWTNRINATASGSTLKKSGGCDGCADSGAVSRQVLPANGYVQFAASETTSLRILGLATGTAVTPSSAIAFAFALRPGGVVEVRESGVYRADTSFAPGDVLRISVLQRVVTYAKNGAVIYQSALSPPSTLRVHASLLSESATVKRVQITK